MASLTKPDFNNNILNVSATLAEFLGCENQNPTLPILKRELEHGFKNVVFIIFDGLGINPINVNLREEAILRRCVKQTLTSVFPATTTNATTTLHTNSYPMQHGRFGWAMYFEELGRNVDIYLSKDSKTGEAIDPDFVDKTLKLKPYYLSAKTDYEINRVAPPYWKDGCTENRIDCLELNDYFEALEKVCKKDGKQFVYMYCPEPDATMHDYGVSSEQAFRLINHINDKMKELCSKCNDTIFIITADHGQSDVDGYVELYKDEQLYSLLQTPPYLESRATAFKVKEGKKQEFERLFKEKYSEDFELYKSEELVRQGNFGGSVKDENVKYLGDFIAICKGYKQFVIYEKSHRFKGHHCSLTEEVFVPLILIENKIPVGI